MAARRVQRLLDNLGKSNPKVIEELVPNILTVGQVQKVLQKSAPGAGLHPGSVDHHGNPGRLRPHGPKDPDILTEYVRQNLARSIVKAYVTPEGVLPVMTLDPGLEERINESVQHTEHGSYLNLDPSVIQRIVDAVKKAGRGVLMSSNYQPVVLTSPMVRAARPPFDRAVHCRRWWFCRTANLFRTWK